MSESSTRSLIALTVFAVVAAQIFAGCPPEEETLTNDEAREALDEAMLSSQAEALTYETIEITTDFTIGAAVEDAMQEMKAFVESQIPCAAVTLADGALTIDYGATGDTCFYNGKLDSGSHTVQLARNEDASVEVAHTWEEMSDGRITVNGVATVTWNRDALTRNVVHDLTWSDGARTVQGSGDRTQRLLDDALGIQGGIQIDGARDWTTSKGSWHLDINDVEVRAQDPVPQRGSYVLTNPGGKQLSLAFTRLDDDTIEVAMTGTRRDRVFEVTRAGAVQDTTDE